MTKTPYAKFGKKHRYWQRCMETRSGEYTLNIGVCVTVNDMTKNSKQKIARDIARDSKRNPNRFWQDVNKKNKQASNKESQTWCMRKMRETRQIQTLKKSWGSRSYIQLCVHRGGHWANTSLCNRLLRSAGSPRLGLRQLAARACHHSIQILGDNPRAQKPPQWPLQKYSRMIHMCTRYLPHTLSGRNRHYNHPNEAHIFSEAG